MNTKIIRSILVLTLCLASALASAQGLKIKPLPKGKVSPKISLPNAGVNLNLLPKGPVETIKTTIKDIVSHVSLGKSFDEEMDTLATDIAKALEEKDITGEQNPFNTFNSSTDLHTPETWQGVHISAGEKGTILSREKGLRDIYIPGARLLNEDSSSEELVGSSGQQLRELLLPLLPYGDKFVSHFDGKDSLDLLKHSMPPEVLQNDPYAADLLQLSLLVYKLVAKDQYVLNTVSKGKPISWSVDIAIDDAILKTIRKTRLKDIPPLAESVFTDDEVPGFADAVNAVTFTEYMVKVNDFNFPFFGQHAHLNTRIVSLWHKLWTNELSPEIGQFLLKDYIYAFNARDIGTILDTVYEDFLRNHKFPGINFGAELETLEKLCADIEANNLVLPSQEFEEVRLGMEVILLVRTLPSSPFWQELDEITRRKVDTMRNLLEGGLENGKL